MIFIAWIGLSFLVGLLGNGKKIGFWGVFFISLLLSPIIGLIVALVSSEKGGIKVTGLSLIIDNAKKAEFRGDKDEALKYYMDAQYHINSKRAIANKHMNRFYDKKEIEIAQSISKLK